MDLSQHIRISGTFVIFQGIYGDGLCNTIDYIEPLVSSVVDDVNDGLHHEITDKGVHPEPPILMPHEENTTHDTENSVLLVPSESNRSIVTPPPSCPIPATSSTDTRDTSNNIVPNVDDGHHNCDIHATAIPTTSISESYIPPTKVAKTSTLEETINAISTTTINAGTNRYHNSHFVSNVNMEVEESVTPDPPLMHSTDDTKLQSSVHSGGLVSGSDEDGDDLHDVTNRRHTTDDDELHHRHLAQQWESECRTIELYHRKEWYENALSQTTTTTIYSSISRTEKEQYSNILHPQHCLAFGSQKLNDSHRTDDDTTNASPPSIPWWMSPESGCIAILDQIPTPPIRIQAPAHLLGVNMRSNMLLPSPTPCHRIGSLWPGTIVVATELITLSSNTNNPEVPVFTPIAITPISDDGDEVHIDLRNSTTNDTNPSKIYVPGRLGWIQLLKIISPMSGYCVLSIDGYAFAGQGLPHQYIPGGRRPMSIDNFITSNADHDTELSLIHNTNQQQQNKNAVLDGWYWRVMCIEGAYVRNGIDLTAHHVATIPYGSLVRVLRKSINAMGLSRLQIEAIYYTSPTTFGRNDGDRPQYVTGWISEFLNPLSGQRGPIVLPLPFPVPALYEVSLPEGAVIRSDVELSSPMIGQAPFGTVVSVIGCTFTEQPKDQCVARYRLAGNGGYINVKLNVPAPQDCPVVQYIGIDNEFNPNEPKTFHLRSVQKNISLSRGHVQEQSSLEMAKCLYTDPSHISMVGKNNRTTQQQQRVLEACRDSADDNENDNYDDDNDDCSNDDSTVEPHSRPLCGLVNPPPRNKLDTTNTAMTALRKKGSPSNHTRYFCVICLCEERTATIIHGETGHIACCLLCARILKARGDHCPVCRLPIDTVIQHFWA